MKGGYLWGRVIYLTQRPQDRNGWKIESLLFFCFVFIDREILKKDPFLVFTTFLRILVAPFKERPSGRDGNKGLLVQKSTTLT